MKLQDQQLNDEIEECGFTIIPQVAELAELRDLIAMLGPVSGAGRRGLLGFPAVASLARSERLLEIVRPHVPSEPFPVRAICFDKSTESNWLVSWHQDLTLALRERAEVPGFGPWSEKDGIAHVQPPADLLQKMLTVRLHLDDADETNGALRVLPGSHRFGRLSADRIQSLREQETEFLCAARAGDVLLMRPLLLHASGRSTSMCHRRVLHVEYAAFDLPSNLRWHDTA